MPDFRFQHRRTTTATADPDEVLLKGEWGIEFDDTTGAFVGAKMGDGVTAWSALPYLDAGGGGGTDDQTAVEVPFTPAGGLAATHVQAALEELDTEKQPLDAVLTATTASFTTTKDTKLTGIATGATANDTDANLRARSSHTGAQAISTVTGLQTALDGKLDIDGEYEVNTVAASGATETLTLAPAHAVTMDQNCTFTFPTPSAGHTFLLRLSGAFTPTFPASVDWDSATAPTYASPSEYGFTTKDGGTTWVGTLIASALG